MVGVVQWLKAALRSLFLNTIEINNTIATIADARVGIERKDFAAINEFLKEITMGKDKDYTIKDSGERTDFGTGAVRDMHEGKGDMISVPWESVLRASVHYEKGAKKYGRLNYKKGIPISSFMDSLIRHAAKYMCGEDDEDHLAAIFFNVCGAMYDEQYRPDMMDLACREGKKRFAYFDIPEGEAK